MYTIGQLAKQFGLSRSTLLYYDSVGLLRPTGRSGSNYRTYTENDVQRLEKIVLYREMGISLKEMPRLLDAPINENVSLFEEQLKELGEKIQRLRRQQYAVVRLLNDERLLDHIRVLDHDTWVALLYSIGMNHDGTHQWHVQFERISPSGHQDFLEAMGLPEGQIQIIREKSRGEWRENDRVADES